MVPPPETLRTGRLVLTRLAPRHAADFAVLNSDPQVVHDYAAPLTRAESDAKLARYMETFERFGHGRWAIETPDSAFLGYCGVQPSPEEFQVAPGAERGMEIGWRLLRPAWGQGFATEAARAALADFWRRCGAHGVLATTGADNLRSQAVMNRLGMERRAELDFDYAHAPFMRLLVWLAIPPRD